MRYKFFLYKTYFMSEKSFVCEIINRALKEDDAKLWEGNEIERSLCTFDVEGIKNEIEKETKTFNNKVKALNQEGQNYRLVTSADNVQVPVPKGYVASSITGENYVSPKYSHTNISHKGNYTELTWSSPAGQQYPWTQDENGIWISGNQGIPSSSSTLESEEFYYIKGTIITIKYTFS